MAKKTITQKVGEVAKAAATKAVQAVTDVAGGWAGLRKSLDAGDHRAIEDFLIRKSLPLELAGVLAMVRPLAAEFEATLKKHAGAETPADVEAEMRAFHRMAPRSVTEAQEQVIAIRDAEKRHARACGVKSNVTQARRGLAGLHAGFAELFGNEKSGRCHSGVPFPAEISNALNEIDLKVAALYWQPWHLAFRREIVEPHKRRRLVAAEDPNR